MSVFAVSSVSTPAQPTELTPQQRNEAAHLRGAALKNAPAAEQRAAVASQFEAIFVRQLLGKSLTSMVGGDKSASSSIYGDMLTDTFAQQLTAGSGMGLARMLEKQLAPHTPVRPDGNLKSP